MTQPFVAEDRFCANPHCLIGRWSVTLHSDVNQVWHVISCYDDESFFVSAPTPLCPCCAETLLTPFELEDGFTEDGVGEDGPLFEFVRQLS